MSKDDNTENIEAIEQEVYMWLEKMGIPQQNYDSLSPADKGVLHNLVVRPTHPTSYQQRRELYRNLCLREMIAGRDSAYLTYLIPSDERLREFFSPLPLTPAERLDDLYKY